MAGRNRGSSPYHDDSFEDYSDDFDEDDDGGNRRYKTRSPYLRTASGSGRKNASIKTRPDVSRSSDSKLHNASQKNPGSIRSVKTRPIPAQGTNTYRKARGGMSVGSGYFTPSSRITPESEYDTPRLSLKTEYESPQPGKKSNITAVSQYLTPRSHKRVFYRSNRGRGKGRGRGNSTGRMSQEPKFDAVAKRVMSARRLKINELHNLNQELQLQLKDLKEENKLYKKTQLRQDKALQRFEDRESDLPNLIQRQNNEVRSLRDQIRKWREKYEKTDRYLRDAEDELEKVKIKLKKLKSLADEKDLPERGELNRRLNKADLDLEERDVKIKELERHIQNLEKNHRHELGIERARQKDVNKQVAQLKEENERLSTNVKEKEKEIQMKNIYANRMVKPPHRLPNSYNGTPHDTPPPRKRRPSVGDAEGVTPRERAKQMEQKRREELRKQRELKQYGTRRGREQAPSVGVSPRHLFKSPSQSGVDMSSRPPSQQHEKVKREKELRRQREREEQEREELERRDRLERDDRERREREEQDRRDYERRERELNEQAKRDEEERQLREERNRRKQEAEDRLRLEKEKKEREERQRREKREQEERDRRERERKEQERRAQEERKRFEDDVSLQAERKKKDEILQKLREIDEGVKDKPKDIPKDKSKFKNDPFFVTQDKEGSQDSLSSSKKGYAFSRPIENLHNGRPARKSNTLGSGDKRKKHDTDSLELGGYNPTFGSSRGAGKSTNAPKSFSLFDDDEPKPSQSNTAKPVQKSRLMEDLFGSKDGGNSPKHDDIFAAPAQSKKTTNPSSSRSNMFPWEDESKGTNSTVTAKPNRENSATLFGGGSALFNDEEFFSKSNSRTNASLPRRQKQTTTAFHSRPTVNAVDHLDDDIEEVIL